MQFSFSRNRRFREDERGAFALMFALALLPMMFAIGYAVEFARGAATREAMQSAVDSAALAGAALRNEADRDASMRIAFDNALRGTSLENIRFSTTPNADGDEVTVDGRGTLPLFFGGVIGMSDLEISASATADVSNQQVILDLAMCIDATGSMGGTISAAKNAAATLHAELTKELKARGRSVDRVRARGLFYRDYEGDDPPLWTSPIFPLPEESAGFKSFIDSGFASGGGDWPEAGLECFNAAMETAWTRPSGDKIVIPVIGVWTDADADAPDNPSNRESRPDIYPPSMPRTYGALEAKWSDPRVIPQENKLLVVFNTQPLGSGWQTLKDWEGFVYGGHVSAANANMVETLAEAIAKILPPIRLTR